MLLPFVGCGQGTCADEGFASRNCGYSVKLYTVLVYLLSVKTTSRGGCEGEGLSFGSSRHDRGDIMCLSWHWVKLVSFAVAFTHVSMYVASL
jgi:hypothetical protein